MSQSIVAGRPPSPAVAVELRAKVGVPRLRKREIDPLVRLVRAVPRFAQLPPRTLRKLAASFKEEAFAPNQVILDQASNSGLLRIIQSGRAEVRRGDEVERVLRAGDHFYDWLLVDGRAVPATVRSMRSVRTLAIKTEDFLEALEEDVSPSRSLITSLSLRILDGSEFPLPPSSAFPHQWGSAALVCESSTTGSVRPDSRGRKK